NPLPVLPVTRLEQRAHKANLLLVQLKFQVSSAAAKQ
ncbi:jg24905, partial [Pararge aegeria aegeria]